MTAGQYQHSTKAVLILVGATFFWGASFCVMKALLQHQQALHPGTDTLYLAAVSLLARFGLSALLLAAWQARLLRTITRREFAQAAGLGFFGGLGILLQMEAINFVPASTSAFLTQCYCVFVPVFLAGHRRALPTKALMAGCVMVMAGVAVLSRIQWTDFHLGRGEWETILGSLFFTGQILWLERPVYATNRPGVVTVLMFVLLVVLISPIAFLTSHGLGELRAIYSSWPAVGLTIFLALACTLIPYSLMNYWQRHVPATQASLIYAAEPLVASALALFLPAWLSRLAHLQYANEILTNSLLLGGGLITAANVLVMWQAQKKLPEQC